MNFLVRCDMEGISGITSIREVLRDYPEYQYGQAMLMNDLLALVEGINKTGRHRIALYDMHTDGRNVDLKQLPENVVLYRGKPSYKKLLGDYRTEGFDGLILLGYHAINRIKDGLLAHQYEEELLNIKVNGTFVGEIEIEAGLAGEFGIPLLLVTGEETGIRYAHEVLGDFLEVAVKKGLSRTSGLCYSPRKNYRLIKEKGEIIGRKKCRRAGFTFRPPVTLEIEYQKSDLAEKLYRHRKNLFTGRYTLRLKGSSLKDLWLKIEEMKSKE